MSDYKYYNSTNSTAVMQMKGSLVVASSLTVDKNVTLSNGSDLWNYLKNITRRVNAIALANNITLG
jgi:hypothetical protein